MLKKVMATAAVTLSVVGAGATMAPQALAVGDHEGTTSFSGNGATQAYGNAATHGDQSPQLSAVQGSLNKLCVGLPAKANVGSLIGILVPITAQDIPILSAAQNQQCTENSTQAKGDEPLSHLLSNIPVLSGNGAGNS
ncbi:rodlin [Streptomyces sp. NPDC057638]|uniref:rodlin n=1 Tax=Streptomyces sp. NPDC057638 TaxID=3346190 RepID=UPI0036A7ABDD